MSWSKGEAAEAYVAARLAAEGWTIAARNFRRRGCELDIVALRGERLLCIEVKARRFATYEPLLDLGPHKLRRLHQGMHMWLQVATPQHSEGRNPEFWLCSVLLTVRRGRAPVRWMRLPGD